MAAWPCAKDFFIKEINIDNTDRSSPPNADKNSYSSPCSSEENSIYDYFDHDDEHSIRTTLSLNSWYSSGSDADLSAPTLSDNVSTYLSSENDDTDDYDEDTATCSNNSAGSSSSEILFNSSKSQTSTSSPASGDIAINRDVLPKSFLQLKGIVGGNFNMGCNFRIDDAISIMIN